jgi:serine/threonine-protein kinase
MAGPRCTSVVVAISSGDPTARHLPRLARMTAPLDDLARLLPDYEVGRELGHGQVGVVYAGRHRHLDRPVAIKVLVGPRDAAGDEHGSRFRREARILAQLDHPHVVGVYDYREDGDLRLLVMELLAGGTLGSRQLAGLAPEGAVAATLAAACGLHHAHTAGILHRDVKPENLMFDGAGTLKVTDFGLARGDAAGATAVHLTQAGRFYGTPAFAAPEQAAEALGGGWPAVGPAADQYALAAVLYHLLSGKLTHESTGGFLALCSNRMNHEARPLRDLVPGVPAPIEEAIMRGLRRDPAARHPSVEAFGLALARAATASFGPGWLARSDIAIREAGPIRAAAEAAPTLPAAPLAAAPSPRPAAPVAAAAPAATTPSAAATPAPATAPVAARRRHRPLVLGAATVALAAAVTATAMLLPRRGGTGSGDGTGGAGALTIEAAWAHRTGGDVFASPAVAGDLVVVGSEDGAVYGLDLATGDQRWRTTTDDSVQSSAAIDDGQAIVGSNDGRLRALDLADGATAWSADLGYQLVSSPTVAGDLVLVGADGLHALDRATGDERWSAPTGDVIVSSPAVAGDVAVVGSNDGAVYGIDLADGTRRWRVDTGGPVVSSPRIAGGIAYVGGGDGRVFAIEAATGDVRWKVPVGGGGLRSSPALGDDTLYVGTGDHRVVALALSDGSQRWSSRLGGRVSSSPALTGGLVVVGSDDGRVSFLDAAGGAVRGTFDTGGAVLSSPRVAGDLVVVGSSDDHVYALRGFRAGR